MNEIKTDRGMGADGFGSERGKKQLVESLWTASLALETSRRPRTKKQLVESLWTASLALETSRRPRTKKQLVESLWTA